MIVRRSFRMGLRIGLLVGIAFAIYKTMQTRRGNGQAAPEPWQPIVDTPRPRPPVDEVGEPVMEPPRDAAEPVRSDLRMPDVPPAPAAVAEPGPAAVAEPAPVDAEVAMVAAEVVDPEPIAKPEPVIPKSPLDVVAEKPEAEVKPEAPVKKAAKAAKKAVKKAVKKATAATKAVEKAVETAPAPKKAAKKAAKKATPAATSAVAGEGPAYVQPVGLVCPPTHQVKAKLSTNLFHLPGMAAYDRTRADRCYIDPAAAEADGFTQAKR